MRNVILGEYDDKNKCKKDSKNFSNIYNYNDNVLMQRIEMNKFQI